MTKQKGKEQKRRVTIADVLDPAENGFITQSRLILLDSPLVFFTALTALSFTCFTNKQEQGPSHAFTVLWWFWLAATGLCLGATLSVKWVGLFTIAWVGSLTVLQLWVLLGDTKNVTPVCNTLVYGIEIETDYCISVVGSNISRLGFSA